MLDTQSLRGQHNFSGLIFLQINNGDLCIPLLILPLLGGSAVHPGGNNWVFFRAKI